MTNLDAILVQSPYVTLTKRDVAQYYKKVTPRILENTGENDVMLRQSFAPNKQVLRRKDPAGGYVKLRTPQDILRWVNRRTTEIHPVYGRTTDHMLVDIDPGTNVRWRTVKSMAETVAKMLRDDPGVKNVKLQFSGDRGFYVRGYTDKQMDIDVARRRVRSILRNLEKRDDVSFNKPDDNQIRLDTSPFKNMGSVKAPYSLSARTGLVAAPVALRDMPGLQKKDFMINKILSKTATIRRSGDQWVLYDHAGKKVLGRHPSREAALRQERAIQAHKYGAAEFAPGIPSSKKIGPIPRVSKAKWDMAIQRHEAHRAGVHYDLRLVNPATSVAHSFAVPKARLPRSNSKMLLAIQQPDHTSEYALNFKGTIPRGTYGAGRVSMPVKERVSITTSDGKIMFTRPNGKTYILFNTHGNKWGLIQKKGQ